MGRNIQSKKDLQEQAHDKLQSMLSLGESKKENIKNGTSEDKIFSINTYKTYWKHTKYFCKWVKENHPECTTLKSARKHVNEWLQERVDKGLSAYTVHTEAKALAKLYGIRETDKDYFQCPKRERKNITRSRGTAVRDRNFSVKNNEELINFCTGTGLRRSELQSLKGSDLISKEDILHDIDLLQKYKEQYGLTPEFEKKLTVLQDAAMFSSKYFVHVRNGKGGRERISPIIGKNAEKIVQRMKDTAPDQKVWLHVSGNADIHSYRADYATSMYRMYTRDLRTIPYDKVNAATGKRYQSEVYCCRKDEKGKRLDKKAMLMCSKALGHNRVEIVANNYLRNL